MGKIDEAFDKLWDAFFEEMVLPMPEDKMKKRLRELEARLDEQAKTIAKYQKENEELKKRVESLDNSLTELLWKNG